MIVGIFYFSLSAKWLESGSNQAIGYRGEHERPGGETVRAGDVSWRSEPASASGRRLSRRQRWTSTPGHV